MTVNRLGELAPVRCLSLKHFVCLMLKSENIEDPLRRSRDPKTPRTTDRSAAV